METNVRLEIIAHACRWSMNMLVEVCNNHATILDRATRQELQDACRSIANASELIRERLRNNP